MIDRLRVGAALLAVVLTGCGTNSDPTTWAEMANEIVNDAELAPFAQPWFFFYQSSNPVFYSGGLLAESLRSVVEELDPEGEDTALRKAIAEVRAILREHLAASRPE